MASEMGPPITELIAETKLNSTEYDGIIYVHITGEKFISPLLEKAVVNALTYNPSLNEKSAVLPTEDLPAGRIIYCPIKKVDPDYDDVRIMKNTTMKAVKKALKTSLKKPLLVLEKYDAFPDSELVMLLGALQALYVPIQLRELDPSKKKKITALGVYTPDYKTTVHITTLATTLETGRRVACDIGDADPERMAPPKVEAYLTSVFQKSQVTMCVIKDTELFAKEYPLFEAVNRAASNIDRHQGRIIFLEYNPPNPSEVKTTLYLVGKGVTYDTGGADVKANGVMAGMSRDKCGAAAAAGFMKIVNDLAPKDIKVVAGLSLVRNSIGSNSYVADELITARSGARVRVGNTDAEGRMVMADVLCKFKEDAVEAVNPHLFTIATLTGHALLAVGEGYSIVMDNGPARKSGHDQELQKAADVIGDPFEISIIRKEDFDFHRGKVEAEDIMQSNNLPSSRTARGHQGPAAFLVMSSGLEEHGSGHKVPLKYSHIDIAASAGEFPDPATGAPVLALAKMYLLK